MPVVTTDPFRLVTPVLPAVPTARVPREACRPSPWIVIFPAPEAPVVRVRFRVEASESIDPVMEMALPAAAVIVVFAPRVTSPV